MQLIKQKLSFIIPFLGLILVILASASCRAASCSIQPT